MNVPVSEWLRSPSHEKARKWPRSEWGSSWAWAEMETETGIQREANRGSGGEMGLGHRD